MCTSIHETWFNLPYNTDVVHEQGFSGCGEIAEMLHMKFPLVFDGWSAEDNTHYIAAFVTFPEMTEPGYSRILLTMSPMGDGDSLTAQEHYDFVTYSLCISQVLGKCWV